MLRSTLLPGLVAALLLIAAHGLVTVGWQEPVSALRAALAGDPAPATAPGAAERRAMRSIDRRGRRFALLGRALRRRAGDGGALGRLRAPVIGLDAAVVEGVGPDALRRGAGHDPRTPLPGTGATVAIAGRRATHGAPFRELDALRRGDRLELDLPYARFRYAVESVRVVDAGAPGLLARAPAERLLLSGAEPRLGGDRRLVVAARLVDARTKRTRAP